MSTIVIMPGGFHPFHAGHASLYNAAKQAFPDAAVFVAATNDTSTRPFPFAIKEKLAKVAGVEDGHFVQVNSPFKATEITSHFNPERDTLIFVRSEKDRNESPKPGGTKKDGTASYFQPYDANNLQPFAKHAYFAYLPTIKFGPGITSATEIRNAWPTLDDRRKTAMVMSLYPATQKNPKLAANVVKLLDIGMPSEVEEGILGFMSPKKAPVKKPLDYSAVRLSAQSAAPQKQVFRSPEEFAKSKQLAMAESYDGEVNSTASNVIEMLYATAPEIFSNYGDEYVVQLIEKIATTSDNKSIPQLCHQVLSALKQGLDEHIVKHGSGYRLLSHKGKNLGTFPSKAGAEKHEREVEYFKHADEKVEETKEEFYDPYVKRALDVAKQHYPGSKSKQEAFIKFVQRSLEHAKHDDAAQDIQIKKIEQELANIKKLVQRPQPVMQQGLDESVMEGKIYSDKKPKLSGLSFTDLDRLSESAGANNYSNFDNALKKNLNLPAWTNTVEIYGVYLRKLTENKLGKVLVEGQQSKVEQSLFNELAQRSDGSIQSAKVGDSVALLHLVTLNIPGHKVVAKLNGFLNPKEIVKITNSGSSQQLEFVDGSRYPEKDGGDIFQQTQGWNMTKLFPSYESASKAYTFYGLVSKRMSNELEFDVTVDQQGVAEGSEDLVQIEYWQQETMESGRWVKTKPIPRATAEKIVNSFERGEIVDVEQGVAEGEEDALQYATQAHAGQTRSGGDPYITHPMRVADHIRQYKQSHNLDALISAAYLHDTIEDTDTTQEALHDLFGGLVASLVKELTSDPEQIKKMGKAQYLSHKMAAMSSYGLVIKLADRLDNVKDITTARTPQWRAKYAAETNQILNYIEKTRALSGTHNKLISLIRAKLAEIDNPPQAPQVADEGITRRGILKGLAGAGALGAAGKASAIAGAFPTPSHQAAMYKAAADSNAAQARADAAAKAKADAQRLQHGTDDIERLNKINYHGGKVTPTNAEWDGDGDFMYLDGTQYSMASRMPIKGDEPRDMKLISTREGRQVYIWTRYRMKGDGGHYFYPAPANTPTNEDYLDEK